VKSLVKGVSVIALTAMTLSTVAPAFAHHNNQPKASTASVGVSQSNGGQIVLGDGDNNAGINAYAFASASGNVGANDASGNANQQNNTTYIDYATTLNDVAVGNSQSNGGNVVIGDGGTTTTTYNWKKGTTKTTVTTQNASIAGNAFNDASGNIGANVASGNLNQQSNVAVLLANDDLSVLTIGTSQHTGGSLYLGDGLNEATIGDDAFNSASGNIGANVAAGNANQQSNTLVVNTYSAP